jgi:hypothetical protein
MRKCLIAICAVVLVVSAGTADKAEATTITLNYDCITQNNAGDCNIGEAQLFTEVTDLGGMVEFLLHVDGSNSMSAMDAYFRDPNDLLGDLVSMTGSAGVKFVEGAKPKNPPGANGFTLGFSAQSAPPSQPNGINPGEWLKIAFLFTPGSNFANLLTAFQTEAFLAIHVGGYETGGSETLKNNIVPEPALLVLFGIGLLVVGRKVQRRT